MTSRWMIWGYAVKTLDGGEWYAVAAGPCVPVELYILYGVYISIKNTVANQQTSGLKSNTFKKASRDY